MGPTRTSPLYFLEHRPTLSVSVLQMAQVLTSAVGFQVMAIQVEGQIAEEGQEENCGVQGEG